MTERTAEAKLSDLVAAHDVGHLQQWLAERPDHEIAEEITRADQVTAGVLFRLLDKDRASEVFGELDGVEQQKILSAVRDQSFRDIVEGMDPDDRARLLGEAPANFTQRVLAGLSPRERELTATLLGYEPGSVGRFMTPEVVRLKEHITVGEALERVRREGPEAETVYTLPVTDAGRRLIGVVGLKDLVLADPADALNGLIDTAHLRAHAGDTAESAARLMQEGNLLDLPVVDSEDRLVGLLTIDDALEVIEAADTEDIARQAAASPIEGHYLTASVLRLARSRVVWLLLLIVAATLTAKVLEAFEADIAKVTALALFIPLLVGTGGNVGAQAATGAVRAIAVGEVRPGDVLKVAWRECRVGFLLGVMLGVVGLVFAWVIAKNADIALVVGLTLVAVCAWAAVIGGGMPLLARKLGIDPAVISAPLVTTFVDATGLIIYFMIARVVLGL
ncbi:magnesium transporter [Streptomyces indicus]|uniref:Magnesium transporter MgtE n=1 Tax=Streptomyces indicus TaxID=417292 RepID=A0A1G9JJC0_9ACTN|nr:magnesium transporter [Streptomyces indicus]SDL37336.1 magnesium transporter [Streptomyces indicus]